MSRGTDKYPLLLLLLKSNQCSRKVDKNWLKLKLEGGSWGAGRGAETRLSSQGLIQLNSERPIGT